MSPVTADPLYLCLDQGGHASRALVFDGRGACHAQAARTVGTHTPQPEWVEQDPEELVKSLHAVVTEAVTVLGARAADLAAAGLATQRSSLVCWDRATGAALSPVLSWQDRRARAWLEKFSEHEREIQRRTGLRLSAHYGASKMRWCLDQLPAVARARDQGRLAIAPLASFLLFRLLDERPMLIDPANAARTLLWNVRSFDWDPWLLGLFGVSESVLPRCVATHHGFGSLRANARRLPLTVVTGDQSAALFAQGAPRADTLIVNLGTGAFIQRVTRHAVAADGLLTGVVYRDADQTWHVLEGTVNGAGAALRWAEREWGMPHIESHLSEWLARDADVPLFLNGVAGLGAPYWIADFPTRLVGDGAPWQKGVAVAESIVFLLQANLERMRAAQTSERLVATGGLARLDGLCQRLADLSGLSVARPIEPEATARGTAYLLAGLPVDWPELAPAKTFTPGINPALTRRYEDWRAALRRALERR